jgi:glycosyltransferase involved in cell wall biosynthesis
LKVALLSNEGGGISSVTYGLAHSLAKKRIHTTVITGTSRSSAEKACPYIEIVRLPVFDLPPRSLWFQIQNLHALFKLSEKHTILHGVSPYVSLAYALLEPKARRPLVTSIHGTPRGTLKAFMRSPISSWNPSDFGTNVLELPLNDFTVRKCVSNSDHVVVCSYSAFNELRSCGAANKGKISVIYNGIDFREIEKIEYDDRDQEDGMDNSIIYAGRLYWMKGVMLLLKAFQKLSGEYKSLHLKIFGKGPLKSEIQRFVARKGLSARVRMFGHVPHNVLIGEIKRSALVVFPSLYESQPMFALESLACRKPLVVFDLPYAREIVASGRGGLLAKPYDIEDLSEKIRLLVSDKRLRLSLGEIGYEHVKKNHDWDVLVEKYIRIYQSLEEEPS